jgi:protein-disulfide isomerase
LREPSLQTIDSVAQLAPLMKRALPFLVIIAVLVVAVVGAWMLVRSPKSGNSNSTTSNSSEPDGAQPPHVRGKSDAPNTLEEFGDFQCPSCGIFYSEVKKIEDEYGDRLRVIFREFPLVPTHQHALEAAQAAEAAGLQGRFWEMHDKLYENQKAWSDVKDVMPMFIDYARQIGLDTDRFSRDFGGEAVAQRIFQDGKRGHALGVTGTPSFFVNGKEYKADQSFSPDGLRDFVKKSIAGAASK